MSFLDLDWNQLCSKLTEINDTQSHITWCCDIVIKKKKSDDYSYDNDVIFIYSLIKFKNLYSNCRRFWNFQMKKNQTKSIVSIPPLWFQSKPLRNKWIYKV